MKTNYVDAFRSVTEFLEELIADKLDVNRKRIKVTEINPEIVAEVAYDDENDNIDTYYKVKYADVDDPKTKGWKWNPVKTMYWLHTESMFNHSFSDVMVSEDEFANIFNDGENA